MARVYPGAFLFEASAGALRFLLPLALAERSLGPAGIGVVIAVFAFVSLVSRGVVAGLYRYRRAGRLIVASGVASSVAFLALPVAEGVPAYAALMALDGVGWAVVTTSLLAMVLTHTPQELPSTSAMSWHVGIQGAALAAGAFAGGLLGQVLGVWPALVGMATLPALAGLVITLRLPAPGTVLVAEHAARAADREAAEREAARLAGHDAEQLDVELMGAGGPGPITSLPARGLAWLRGLPRAARDMPLAVWIASIVAAYLNVMNSLLQSFFPLLGIAAGLSLAQVGTLSGLRTAISSVARFAAGWIFDRVPAQRSHVPLLTASSLSVALLPLTAASFLATLPLMAFSGISRGLLRVTTSAAAMDALSGRRAGPAAAVMTAGLDAGKIVGPLMGGIVATLVGLEAMFVVLPLAFLAVALVGHGAARFGRRDPTRAVEA